MIRKPRPKLLTPLAATVIGMSMLCAPNVAMAYSTHRATVTPPTVTEASALSDSSADLSETIKEKDSLETILKDKETQYKDMLSRMLKLLDLNTLIETTSNIQLTEATGHDMVTLGSLVIGLLERQELSPDDTKVLNDMKKLNDELIEGYNKLDKMNSIIKKLTDDNNGNGQSKSKKAGKDDGTKSVDAQKPSDSKEASKPDNDAKASTTESEQDPKSLPELKPNASWNHTSTDMMQSISEDITDEDITNESITDQVSIVSQGYEEIGYGVEGTYGYAYYGNDDSSNDTTIPYDDTYASSDSYDDGTYDGYGETETSLVDRTTSHDDAIYEETSYSKAESDETGYDKTGYNEELNSKDTNANSDDDQVTPANGDDLDDPETYETQSPETYETENDSTYEDENRRTAADTDYSSTSDDMRSRLVSAATSQLGVPYEFGAMSPDEAFDCSGFTSWSYSQIGIDLPHSAAEQAALATEISYDEMQEGDLVFYIGNGDPNLSGNHVAMYIGDNQVVHADGTEVAISNIGMRYTSLGTFI